jgi:hypothetical protein
VNTETAETATNALHGLQRAALECLTPELINDRLDIQPGSRLRWLRLAESDGLILAIAGCVDSDREGHIGLIAELQGPGAQILSCDSCWGIEEPITTDRPVWDAFNAHLRDVAAALIQEVCHPIAAQQARRTLQRRAAEIQAAVLALG